MPDLTFADPVLRALRHQHWSLYLGVAFAAAALIALPSGVAAARRLPDRRRIYALNAAGLVAFSCWFAALGWAVLGRRDVSLADRLRDRGPWPIVAIVGVLLVSSLLAATLV